MKAHNKEGRHTKLHEHLNELVECFKTETGLTPSTVTLNEFMIWAHAMAAKPTCEKAKEETS